MAQLPQLFKPVHRLEPELASSPLARPDIPKLTANDEIDLDNLGTSPLSTFIRYAGMAFGDEVFPRWVGAAPNGESFDDVLSSFFIPPSFDPDRGVEVIIANDRLQGAAGGWVFYSYSVAVGAVVTESLRRFCYVGLRPPAAGAETLSVVLAGDAHDLTVNPSSLGTTMALLIPPYQAMQADDEVKLTLSGVDDRGVSYTWERTLKVATPGELLQTAVERTWLRRLEGGYFDALYGIAFKDGATASSPVQRFRVDSRAQLPDLLAPLVIDGLVPGEPLDPARFRDGITVRVPAYPQQGMALSDRVMMYWLSNDNVYQALRVDPSTLASDSLLFTLEPRWLMSSQGRDVALGYQFARAGRSLVSKPLPVTVVSSRELAPPLVLDAVAEAEGGRLPAYLATGGVVVDVPADAPVAGNERIEMHWWGHSEQGRQIVTQPISSARPLRFRVGAGYVAANMERNDSAVAKRFKVFYRLVRENDPHSYVDSEPFMLRVLPLPSSDYPRLACAQASGNNLSLRIVPNGARFTLAPWPYVAEQQWLSVWVEGVWRAEVEHVLWEGQISAQQAQKGIELVLPRATLEQQVIDQSFTVYARVSFDGGHQYFSMRSLSLTLRV